jgi:Protein of unknown function (DUF3137)
LAVSLRKIVFLGFGMKRLDQFRIYYNNTIHPELMRMERKRLRLLRLLLVSGFLLLGLVGFELYVNILPLTLALSMPIVAYGFYLANRIRRFMLTFKPHVMRLVLNFVEEEPNMGRLDYQAQGSLSFGTFKQSELFACKPAVFDGEDKVSGKVGEMDFELCELRVEQNSALSTGLEYVFKGIFLHAIFSEDTHGRVAIWPRDVKHFYTKSIREFTWSGAENVDDEIMVDSFREMFTVYASPETHVAGILSEPMQEAIVGYAEKTGKELYLSFLEKHIFLAVSEPRDILEPFLFRSNLSFELIRTFLEDIYLLLEIVQDFDQTH